MESLLTVIYDSLIKLIGTESQIMDSTTFHINLLAHDNEKLSMLKICIKNG